MPELPPGAQLFDLATGYLLPRCLHVIAELAIADALGDVPMSAQALAQTTGTNADAIHRMLRLVATAGVFEAKGDLWAHTPLSRALRSDGLGSARAFVRMIGDPLNWGAAGELAYAARTGKPAVEKAVPEGIWGYYDKHPQDARLFDEAMTAKSLAMIPALVAACDFSRFSVVADVAGGLGHVLSGVLEANKKTRGILFDLPQVVAPVAASERMSVQAGSFFDDPLPVADAYILSNILHDWADADAIRILKSVHRAAPKHAELLVLEFVLTGTPEPHPAKVLDIIMLSMTTGRERNENEYRALFTAGGFRLDRIVPTQSPMSIIVAKPN
jgi:hypothetical protein